MSDWHEMADGQRIPWRKPTDCYSLDESARVRLRSVPRVPREPVSDSRILGGIAVITFFWAIGFAMGIFAHVIFAE